MTSDTVSSRLATRRQCSAEVKAQVMAECDVPGAPVTRVSMALGINANVVHRWQQMARESGSAVLACTSEFLPVSLAAEPGAKVTPPADIQIQLRRGTTAMLITWPVSAPADFAAWAREILK